MHCLYRIAGKIQSHRGRGRGLGVPTVNISVSADIPDGIYAGWLQHDEQRWPAAIFVGAAITFGETERQAEAHVLNTIIELDGDVTFELIQYIRANQQFPDAASLQQQMRLDIETIQQCLQASSKSS